jgi:hypothetical protein
MGKAKHQALNLETILGFSPSAVAVHPSDPVLCWGAGAALVWTDYKDRKRWCSVLDSREKSSEKSESSRAVPVSCLAYSDDGLWLAVGEVRKETLNF